MSGCSLAREQAQPRTRAKGLRVRLGVFPPTPVGKSPFIPHVTGPALLSVCVYTPSRGPISSSWPRGPESKSCMLHPSSSPRPPSDHKPSQLCPQLISLSSVSMGGAPNLLAWTGERQRLLHLRAGSILGAGWLAYLGWSSHQREPGGWAASWGPGTAPWAGCYTLAVKQALGGTWSVRQSPKGSRSSCWAGHVPSTPLRRSLSASPPPRCGQSQPVGRGGTCCWGLGEAGPCASLSKSC